MGAAPAIATTTAYAAAPAIAAAPAVATTTAYAAAPAIAAGYGGYGYAAPVVAAAAPVITGYSNVSPSASLNIAGGAPAAIPAIPGPAAAGRYVANSAGTVHVAKREADPYFYGGYGLGYAGYGGYA